MAIYDIDRDLLIDAYQVNIDKKKSVKVIHKNSGTIINSTVEELTKLGSISTISSQEECEWASIAACTLAGAAFGGVGGLVCTVATKLICDNCACD
ncbi:hypothetical protein [Paenibacillus melissococcoides]|uniref:hypothetical protein n=1 Tax=Paenibacillus melissococcoides TaxID=2912268 RepID=UPI0038B3F924